MFPAIALVAIFPIATIVAIFLITAIVIIFPTTIIVIIFTATIIVAIFSITAIIAIFFYNCNNYNILESEILSIYLRGSNYASGSSSSGNPSLILTLPFPFCCTDSKNTSNLLSSSSFSLVPRVY